MNLKTNYIDNFYTLDPGRFMDVEYVVSSPELAISSTQVRIIDTISNVIVHTGTAAFCKLNVGTLKVEVT